MNTFPQVQQQIFQFAFDQYGTSLDLTDTSSNCYFFYSVESQCGFLFEQSLGVMQNNLSIYTAQKNNLNGLGTFLNYQVRPYYPFSISVVITGDPATTIATGLETYYSLEPGTDYNFIADQAFVIPSQGTLNATFYYYGVNQVLPATVSSGIELSIVGGSAVIVGTVDSIVIANDYSPVQYTDLDYRTLLTNIYQSSSFGLIGSIESTLKNLNFVNDCKVYIGVNPMAPTLLAGFPPNTYSLDFGVMAIVIDFFSSSVSPQIPYQLAANAIYSRFPFGGIGLYDPSFSNEITKTVTSYSGQTINIHFFIAVVTILNIVVTFAESGITLNNTQQASLQSDIANYLNSIRIGSKLYYSRIAVLSAAYGVNLILLTINGTANSSEFRVGTPYVDERFTLGTFNVSYAA